MAWPRWWCSTCCTWSSSTTSASRGTETPHPIASVAALIIGLGLAAPAALAEPSLVIVVTHSERAGEPAGDPALSPEGRQRARQLADHLASANVEAIITTQWRRTQETAAVLAQRLGIEVQPVVTRRGEAAAHIDEVLAAVHKLSGLVLVVGHSNTVAGMVARLSAERPLALCETSHGYLFLLNPAAGTALQLRYGAADPPPAAGCQ